MHVLQTLEDPPRCGSTIRAHIGWRMKSDAELTAIVRTKGTLVIQVRWDTSRRVSKCALRRKN
jgi:hypothetical protein